MHFIVFIWGFTAILGKLIQVEALYLVWNRVAITGLMLGAWAAYQGMPLKPANSSIVSMMATGLIIAAHWVTFYHAIRISNISLTLAGLATSSFWASLIKALYARQRPAVREWVLSLVALAAMLLLTRVQQFPALAWWTACSSALLAAWFAIINGRFTQREEPLRVAFWEMWGGLLGVSAWMLLELNVGPLLPGTRIALDWDWPWMLPSLQDWFWLLGLALVCTCYPFVASIRLMRRIDPFSFVLSVNMEPVYGIFLGWLLFRSTEQMSLGFYAGTLLLLGAVGVDAWATRYRNRLER
jgi:drug/metabolite transporter (DMT)-like permease